MPKLVYIISMIFLVLAGSARAQEDSIVVSQSEPLPVLAEEDSVLEEATNFSIELSADYGKAIESLATDQKKWEFGISAIFKNNFALVGEYGYGQLYPQSVIQNGYYEAEGNYFRVGLEYLMTIAPKRQLAIGGLFASSSFSDYGRVEIYSELWPDVIEEFSREGFTANWAEIILNTQGPIINAEEGFFSNLYWGVRFRLRIMITDLSQPDFDIYAIPGYGKTYSGAVPAANLFLRYRLNFKL